MQRFVAGMKAAWRWLSQGPDDGAWIVPGQIWAGPYPRTDETLGLLAESNVRCLINLHLDGHDAARLAGFGLTEAHFPTEDFCPPAPDTLNAAAALAWGEIAAGRAVAIHCGGGLGRTGTVVACCLLRNCLDLTAAEAIAQVRALRPGSIETAAQEQAVHEFAARRDSCPGRTRSVVHSGFAADRSERPSASRFSEPEIGDILSDGSGAVNGTHRGTDVH